MVERFVAGDTIAYHHARTPWGVYLFLIVLFFVTQHDFFYSLQDMYSPAPDDYAERVYEGSALRKVGFILLGIYGIASLLRRWGSPLKINGVQGWLIIFYLIWSIASLSWSIETGLTFRRLVLFAMLCLGSLAAARRFSFYDFILFTFVCSGAYLTIGYVSEIVLGTFKPWLIWHRFSGTVHPNTQAIHGALLYLSSLYLMKRAGRKKRLFLLLVAIWAVASMFLTRSRTGTTAALLSPIVFWAFHLRFRHKAFVFSLFMVFLTSTLLLRDVSVPMLQKGIQLKRNDIDEQSDATLTGRIPLWINTFSYMARRPLRGYGYGAFWTPDHILDIAAEHAWAPNQGHSSYVDRMLDLGVVGMMSFVLVYILGIRRAYIFRYHYGIVEYGFLGVILVFCLLDSVLESIILQPNFISFISMVALAHLGFQRPEELENFDADVYYN